VNPIAESDLERLAEAAGVSPEFLRDWLRVQIRRRQNGQPDS
jgi:hypothetical protein